MPLQSFDCFFFLVRGFFFFRSRVELSGYHHNTVTLLPTFRIRPCFQLKVAFNGNQYIFFAVCNRSYCSLYLKNAYCLHRKYWHLQQPDGMTSSRLSIPLEDSDIQSESKQIVYHQFLFLCLVKRIRSSSGRFSVPISNQPTSV